MITPTQAIQIQPSLNEDTPLRWSRWLGSLRSSQVTTTTEVSAAPTMPNSLAKWSTVSSTVTPLRVGKKTIETIVAAAPTRNVAGTRPIPVLSRTAEMITSMMLTSEVIPAKISEMKKSSPKIEPPHIVEMIVGKATKASPMPLSATSITGTPWTAAM